MKSTTHYFNGFFRRLVLAFMMLAAAFNNAMAGNFFTGAVSKASGRPAADMPAEFSSRPPSADYVLITDYGAIGDGNIANANVNATAMANALATGKTVKIPYTAAGYHLGLTRLLLARDRSLKGKPGAVEIDRHYLAFPHDRL